MGIMSTIRCLTLFLLGLTRLSLGSEENVACFDPESLNGVMNSFLHFDILGPEVVSISWEELWMEVDWDICLYDVQIVANIGREDEMAIRIKDPFAQKSTNVSVVPCIENTYVLKAIHEPTDAELVSLGKARPIKTIKSLDLQPNPEFGIHRSYDPESYKVLYSITPDDMFSNLPGDCTTRRTFTLLTRPHGGDPTWKSTAVEHSENEEKIDIHLDLSALKSNEDCMFIDVKLNVNEQGHEVNIPLSSIYPNRIINTGSLSVGHPLEPPSSIWTTDFDDNSVSIAWDDKEVACSTGYILSFLDITRQDEEIGNTGEYTIEKLSPCSSYEIALKTKFGELVSENGSSFSARTSPILPVNQLELTSLKIQTHKRNHVKISWKLQEYPCIRPEEYDVVVSEVDLEDEQKPLTLRNGKVDEKGEVTFETKVLSKCVDHSLQISTSILRDALPLEKRFRTGGEKTKIRGIQVTNTSATTVSLEWDLDPCAKGYQVSHSRFVYENSNKAKFFVDADSDDEGSGMESSTIDTDDEEEESSYSGSGFDSDRSPTGPSYDFKAGRMTFENRISLRTLEPCSKYFINIRGYYAESELGNQESDYGPSSMFEYKVPCPKTIDQYVSTTIKNIEELLAGKLIPKTTTENLDIFIEESESLQTTTDVPVEEPVTSPDEATLRTIYMSTSDEGLSTMSSYDSDYEHHTEAFEDHTDSEDITTESSTSEYLANFAKSTDNGMSKTSDYISSESFTTFPSTTESLQVTTDRIVNQEDPTTTYANTIATEHMDSTSTTNTPELFTFESTSSMPDETTNNLVETTTEEASYTSTLITTTPSSTIVNDLETTTIISDLETTTILNDLETTTILNDLKTTTDISNSTPDFTTEYDLKTNTYEELTTKNYGTTQPPTVEFTSETDLQSSTNPIFSSTEYDNPETTTKIISTTFKFQDEEYIQTTTDDYIFSTTSLPTKEEEDLEAITITSSTTTLPESSSTTQTSDIGTSTQETTTVDTPTTTTEMKEPQLPIQNVVYDFSDDKESSIILSIHWAQARTVHSELRLNKEMISSHDASPNSESDYNTIHINTEVTGCSEYNLDIIDVDTQEVYWESQEVTPLNKYERIHLDELVINESNGLLEWKIPSNYFNCLSGLAITINDKIKNEIPLNVSSLSILEHFSDLKICQEVTLDFVPLKDYIEYDEAKYTSSFKYKPEIKTDINNISDHGATILFGQEVDCDVESVSWTNLKSMETLSSEAQWPSFQVENLDSCTEYEIVIYSGSSKEVVAFKRTIKTLSGEPNVLKDHEVSILFEGESLNISWADQCQSTYILETCLNHLDCSMDDNYDSIKSETPSVTLNNLKQCRTYKYKIKSNDLLLYDGSFDVKANEWSPSTQSNASSFDFLLSEEELKIEWIHQWSCIDEYDIQILEDDTQGGTVFQKLLQPSHNMSFHYNISQGLTNCKSYVLEIRPVIEKNMSLNPLFSEPFECLTGSYSKVDGLHFTTLPSDHIIFEWTKPGLCKVETYVADIFDAQSKVILTLTNTSELLDLDSSLLKQCSRYELQLKYTVSHDTALKTSEIASILFDTKHPESIPISVKEDYETLEFTVGPFKESNQCVDHYVMTLCHFETGSCTQKVFEPHTSSSHTLLFDGLSSKTTYIYEIIGVNDKGYNIFYDSDHQVETKSHIQYASLKLSIVDDHQMTLNLESSILEEHLDPEFSFFVKCTKMHSDDSMENSVLSKTSITFEDLPMGVTFDCKGELIYESETHSLASINVSTLEGIPSAPMDVRPLNVSAIVANIEWNPPVEQNGVIGEYIISTKLICDSIKLIGHCLKECHDLSFESEYSSTSNTLLMKDLLPYREYAVRVRARTSTRKEFGPWSKSFLLRTAPGDPFIPKILSVKGVSSSKVIVDFSYPCLTSGVTRFDISAVKSVQHKHFKHQRAIKKRFEQGRKRFILEGLEGGHNYDIQVTARVDNCFSGRCLTKSDKSSVYLECSYRCNDGSCINKKWNVRCDFIQDCIDGTDERNCTCDPPHFFKCSNGYCLESWKQCDGKVDCNDMSDEAGCPGCLSNQFQCKKSGKCIGLHRTCDRKLDCPDGSDEHDCPYWKKSCWSDEFRCLDASCINSRFVCDGIWDCSGGEDERSCEKSTCSSSSEFTCKPRNPHFPNKESICIPLHKYCDGEKDCVDGSDETFGCECHRIGKFACASGDECTERLRVCDGTINCKDGSDEHNCHRYENSSFIPSTTPSTTTTTTISTTSRSLNNIRHIYDDYEFYDYLESADQVMDREDHRSGLKLRIYPEYQSISIGSDVVIMCRDESDHRMEVIWTRPKKLSMPKKYLDNGKGRLEIYNLKREEAGVYECKSVKPLNSKTPLGIARAFVHMEYHP